jgi:uncharacterized protein (DUF111 family)
VSRLLYVDCFTGISGDMVLGAMLDAGLPFEGLKARSAAPRCPATTSPAKRVVRAGITATKFVVDERPP